MGYGLVPAVRWIAVLLCFVAGVAADANAAPKTFNPGKGIVNLSCDTSAPDITRLFDASRGKELKFPKAIKSIAKALKKANKKIASINKKIARKHGLMTPKQQADLLRYTALSEFLNYWLTFVVSCQATPPGQIFIPPSLGSSSSSSSADQSSASSGQSSSSADSSSNNSSSSESSEVGESSSSSSSSAPPARLAVSSLALDFGNDTEIMTLTVSNEGSGEVAYNFTSPDSWVTFTPQSGVVAEAPQVISVHVNRTNLWLGSSESRAQLRGSDGANFNVTVRLNRAGVPAPRSQVVSWLRALPPLPKRHFTWKIWYSFYNDPDESLLYEMIRINNGVTFADWPNAAILDKLVRICKQVNATNPAIPASIAFVDSPFTRYWPAGAPPTYSGPERADELNSQAQELSLLVSYVAAANARYPGPNIEITHVIYDIELWRLKDASESGYLAWNNAMRANYDALYDITKAHLPAALVDWYSRGWIRFFGNNEPPAWASEPYYHFDLSEQGDTCSASMYRLPMQNASREVFQRTVDYCAGAGVERVVPWLGLAAGYRPTEDNTNVYYTSDWNYDLQVSWNFGHQINDPSDSLWRAAEWVMIYPSPFQAETPYFAQHYVAYVRGAHGMPALPQ